MRSPLALGACRPASPAPADADATDGDDDDADDDNNDDDDGGESESASASNSDSGPTATSASGTNTDTDTDGPVTASAEGGEDGSHETEYPVQPGCEEGDESYGEYITTKGGSGGAEDTSVGMGGDFPLSATVFEIQQGFVPGGRSVELTDVVVTTPPTESPDADGDWVFVQEADGGAHSGILLRILNTSPESEALLPGDRITVRGDFIERYVFASLEVTSAEFQIDYGTPGALPDPVIVTPAEVSAGGSRVDELESVLVQVQEVEVIDPSVCPGEVLVQATLKLDDRFLAANGESIPAPPTGVYMSVQGPLIYTYNGFEVAPRSLDDIVF